VYSTFNNYQSWYHSVFVLLFYQNIRVHVLCNNPETTYTLSLALCEHM